MCDPSVRENPSFLQYVPDWFVMQGQLKIWHDEDDYCNDDELITWYNSYKKMLDPKSTYKRRSAFHCLAPYEVRDWFMTEDKKKKITKMPAWEGESIR